MEQLIKAAAVDVALGCEAVAIALIALGATLTVLRLALSLGRLADPGHKRDAWRRFAGWIVLALEFALGADIARTAIAPTWDEIGQLAAIAAIRTGLNYFLERDIEDAQPSTESVATTK
jgi:uncharacterized membrane protein